MYGYVWYICANMYVFRHACTRIFMYCIKHLRSIEVLLLFYIKLVKHLLTVEVDKVTDVHDASSLDSCARPSRGVHCCE